jgi:tetratricopeptide (TPR) repeat protein|tara:strand:+ start:592 stop:1494 length:903 start_codon:yes stop_codon:yes gene_type:complete
MRHDILWMLVLPFCAWGIESPDERLKKILTADNIAIAEIAGWIEKNRKVLRANVGEREYLTFRIRKRLDIIRQMYTSFLKDHPKHSKARVAYGSFLTHIDNRRGALGQWKKALADDPSNAAALNNIATHLGAIAIQNNIHTHIPEAFQSLEKAITLSPKETLYRHNFATALSLFQLDAMNHYNITAEEVTKRALVELEKCMELAPDNFEIAADRAETFLDIKPLPRKRALEAWENARNRAEQRIQLDWVNLQIAIVHLETNHLDEAKKYLALVSKDSFQKLAHDLRTALLHKREQKKPKP